MSNVGQQTNTAGATNAHNVSKPLSADDKGKNKFKPDEVVDGDEEDDDEDDDDEEEEEVEMDEDVELEEEEDFGEIDPTAILPTGRRTRGVRVDYTSAEALKKAGFENGEGAEGDEEDEFKETS
ncbi:hypothetical protein BU17DRAFT_88954 [Hysterangium stoloniferum]|nr:hypothetical protein BU17DRAFT_88954 [Hysterangium stoloniferum]